MRWYQGAGALLPEGLERTAVWPPVLGSDRGGATGGGPVRGGAAVAVPPPPEGEGEPCWAAAGVCAGDAGTARGVGVAGGLGVPGEEMPGEAAGAGFAPGEAPGGDAPGGRTALAARAPRVAGRPP